MSLKIHQFSGSGFSWRVQLACAVKGVDYTLVDMPATREALKSEAFLALSPRGKVPVIEVDGYVLPESMAAIAYLDRRYPEPPLFGETPEEAGSIWRLVLDFDLYVAETFVASIIVPILTGQIESKGPRIQEAARTAHAEIARLENRVGTDFWFVGPRMSAADIAIFPLLESLLRFATKPAARELVLGFKSFEADYPRLGGWRRAIRSLPAFEATYPEYWRRVDRGLS